MSLRVSSGSKRRLRVPRHSLILPGLCTALTFALPTIAAANTVVLPDPTSAPEHSELASAVSLLVRSYLKVGQRPLTPRRELALAIEAMTGHAPGKQLTVPSELATKLMERLGAEALVSWELQVGAKGTKVAGMLIGSGGKRLLRITGVAATGDVAELARQLARRIAPGIDVTVGDTPEVGLADLRPLVVAESSFIVGDVVVATRAMGLVLPTLVKRLPGAKDTVRTLAEDPALPALSRTQAKLLIGDATAALELADTGLKGDPKNAPLRAEKVRALAVLKDFPAAEKELAALKGMSNQTAIALAAVTLAIERGDPVEKKDEALASLVGRPAVEWRPLLPLIADTPPGTFGPTIEAGALAAAEKLSLQEPGLASTLATRALSGGAKSQQIAPLIKVQELSAEQIKVISASLSAEVDSASAGLSARIKTREEEAKAIAIEAGPERPTGPPSTLASNLRQVLQGFDALYEPSLTSIQIAALPGSGQPFYWPFLVRKQQLADGLLETLMRSPWELQATNAKAQTEVMPPEHLSDEGIATLAHELGCSALLLYRIHPSSLAPWVTVELVLHDVTRQRTDRIETSLIGRSTKLVMLNPLMVVLGALAVLCAMGWIVLISLRGTIVVRVQWDADAKDELFSILISRSPHTPTIENITAYRKKLEWIGKRKRRFEAWNIDQNTAFRSIPRGKWYVHLYGIYTRGRQTMLLREPAQEVEVLPRKTAFAAHVLEASEAEFKLTVLDDHGPVEGARVWLDDQRAKAAASAKDGSVSLKVPKGYHVIHVSARGMEVERPYQVVKSKVHEMTINLVWERRQESVSRALEHQVDDAAAYMTKPPHGSDTVAANTGPQPGHPTTTPAPVDLSQARQNPTGIEISLEDTPIVDLIPMASAPIPTGQRSVSKTAPPAPISQQNLGRKPLSPDLAKTGIPTTVSKLSQPVVRGIAPPPQPASSSGTLDLNITTPRESPADFENPLDLEIEKKKTESSLKDPSQSPPHKPRR
jgi:hypothetical protein